MAYNKQYNRASGRYNTPGQFVSAGEAFPSQPQSSTTVQQNANLQSVQLNEEMDTSMTEETSRPHWMKSKLSGVKKVSNRERRRRQNQNLRRLLSPKNALMVLNEMMPSEQVANQFKVEAASNAQLYNKAPGAHSFCADLNIDGVVYKGYGENKLMARNSAAEQAIRDLIIKKLQKTLGGDDESGDGEGEEALPMIQLASFALHKLFAEWEFEGHKVPQLRATQAPGPGQGQGQAQAAAPEDAPRRKPLPANASLLHPCMLLTYMRPHLEYRELAAEGSLPQNMLFTMGVDVDGTTYIGKASNKKEARKQAAKAACQELFGVEFDPNANCNVPLKQQ